MRHGWVLAIGALCGCGGPMSASDGISPVAGLAQRANEIVQAENPYAGDGLGPNPGGSGARARRVIRAYETGGAPSTTDATAR